MRRILTISICLAVLAGMAFGRDLLRERAHRWLNAGGAGWADPNTYTGLWEMQDTNTTDTSGNNLTAVPLNGAGFVTLATNQFNRVEYGWDLDGTDDRLSASANSLLNFTNALTLAAWVYTHDKANSGIIEKGSLGSIQGSYNLLINNEMYFRLNAGGVQLVSSAHIPLNQWTLIVGTYNTAEGMKLYTNAILDKVNAYATPVTPNAHPLQIGAHFAEAFSFDGRIGTVFVDNKAWTSNAIYTFYQNTHPTNNIRIR